MSRVIELIVPGAEDMRALGEALAGVLVPGDVVALTGDLGAGKTTLVQGAARGLGVADGSVTSPTFTLVREYRGRWPVYHLDVYRLARIQDVIVLGIETSTPQTTVALGTERGTMASTLLSIGRSRHEIVIPAVRHVLEWSGTDLAAVGGIAVGIGPALFTGLRVGVQTAKSLAQVLQVPIVGLASLDV